MKKSITNLGEVLNKTEQKSIQGGGLTYCKTDQDCLVNQPLFCRAACVGSGICIFDTLTCV